MMEAPLRKFLLTAHVVCAVGWLGAVAAFLVFAAMGLAARNTQFVQAAYVSMDLITEFVIVPLALGSLLTGVVSSLGSGWGLNRYYWVLIKLIMTPLASAVLLLHLQPIQRLGAAARGSEVGTDLHQAQVLMVVASSAGVAALPVLTALSIYKPRGMTPFGTPGATPSVTDS